MFFKKLQNQIEVTNQQFPWYNNDFWEENMNIFDIPVDNNLPRQFPNDNQYLQPTPNVYIDDFDLLQPQYEEPEEPLFGYDYQEEPFFNPNYYY